MSHRWCPACKAYRPADHIHITPASLFDEPEPPIADPQTPRVGPFHRDDPETSVVAAMTDLPRKGTQRARVLEALQQLGATGATDYELGERLGLFRWVAGTRRGELIADGWPIVDSGERRLTDTASRAIVWCLRHDE